MKFTLKNLGRLEAATIDLSKKLILLAGPNNTSKTYVAYTIYGFCKRLRRLPAQTSRALPAIGSDGGFDIDWPILLGPKAALILDEVIRSANTWLPELFATGPTFAGSAFIDVDYRLDEAALMRVTHVANAFHPAGPAYTFTTDAAHKTRATPRTISFDDTRMRFTEALLKDLVYRRVPTALFGNLTKPFILTAERSAIQLFGRVLAADRADFDDGLDGVDPDQGDPLSRLKAESQRYSWPIQDGLETATRWEFAKRRLSSVPKLIELADALEKILGGSATTDDTGGITFTPASDEAHGPTLSLPLASSSVKSLVPLVLYLRHIAGKEDFLIIDEPELNLHPDNQRRVARLLAQIANAGIKVMITTHSDYIIRELNNLIMLHADTDGELRRRHGYADDMVLSPSDVGAYLFNTKTAEELEVTETGFDVKTIDEEISKLNAVSQDIYFSLFGDQK